MRRVDAILLGQRGHLFPWLPVAMAIGIASYFALRFEPVVHHYAAVAAIGALGGAWAVWRPGGRADLGWFLAFLAIGFCLAGWRTHSIAGPVLDFRYYGPIEGRIVGIDRSASDKPRVTLDRVYLARMAPERTPLRVRVSLHGDAPALVPGQRLMMTGHLSGPQGPVEPGGFDFRRHAWFLKLGAVGYTRSPALIASKSDGGLRVFSARMAISAHVSTQLPGDVGGFAAAVTTGDRSGISKTALEALRASNTAHLLAISGLHMGLLAGFVFGVLRLVLACIPFIALRWPTKKLAAAGAILAASAYLALSGGNVATERAFVMALVVLVAVFLDRRALSLRSVAAAALIVLSLRPEALLGPGFQMSFAATTALIAVFGSMRQLHLPRWVSPVAGLVLSSLVAGLATAPIGAAHFNALAHYGLMANLGSVPVMGVVVVPSAVLAVLLAPFGLDWVGLWLMGLGLDWILSVAHFTAQLPGARSFVVSPGPEVLPILALGALVVFLWQGRARFLGLVPVCAALLLWQDAARPQVLIAENGALVGVMTKAGRALSKPRGAGFVARTWLENDGERLPQDKAALRWPDGEGRVRVIHTGYVNVVHINGKRAAAEVTHCAPGDVVVSSVPIVLLGACQIWDPDRLSVSGSVALTEDLVVTALSLTGQRRWNALRAQ